jgi:NADH-quinone oxidoreductase subunit D
MLRASGVNYDIRKVDRYALQRFTFRCRWEHGDVRPVHDPMLEARVARDIAAGPSRSASRTVMDPGEASRVQAASGEAYGRIESPKGELGFFLIATAAQTLPISCAVAELREPDHPR